MLQAFFGLAVLISLAWLLSENRRAALNPPVVAVGLGLQFVIALLLLKVPGATDVFKLLADVVGATQESARVGSEFVFGYLAGGDTPFEITDNNAMFLIAFQAFPLILLISTITAVLFHWGVLQIVVRAMARLLSYSMKVGGSLGVGAAANVFVGQIESGLFIRPYLPKLPRADLFAFMTVGMATIAGTVLALYSAFLEPVLPGAFGHLLTASLISVPAALMVARIMSPPATADNQRSEHIAEDSVVESKTVLDAAVIGAVTGGALVIRIVVMLIVVVGLAHLLNTGLTLLPDVSGAPLSLQRMVGWLMAPLVWCMGVPWSEAPAAGELMGVKIVMSELISYVRIKELAGTAAALSPHTVLIMAYSMAGFASFVGAGVLVGGISALAPHRRAEIAALSVRALIAGNLATMMTGAVAGIISRL